MLQKPLQDLLVVALEQAVAAPTCSVRLADAGARVIKIERASAYAGERVVFGRPIGQNQGVQFPIARAYAQMRAAELMVQRAAALFEAGKDCGAEANMAKLIAADASWAAAEACLQTHGGFGFAEEYDVERRFRETRLYQVAPISTNLILSYLAEHVLGLPRSY
jgi:alkylation response protein AidB-like acyl-CoA dehydrogenase